MKRRGAQFVPMWLLMTLEKCAPKLNKYVIYIELQHTDHFIFCVEICLLFRAVQSCKLVIAYQILK